MKKKQQKQLPPSRLSRTLRIHVALRRHRLKMRTRLSVCEAMGLCVPSRSCRALDKSTWEPLGLGGGQKVQLCNCFLTPLLAEEASDRGRYRQYLVYSSTLSQTEQLNPTDPAILNPNDPAIVNLTDSAIVNPHELGHHAHSPVKTQAPLS
ncbi:unnamed protein product [Lampetra fluviatilis]